MKKEQKEHKAEVRRVESLEALNAARKALPGNITHAWYKIRSGSGDYHNLTGLNLVKGHFVYVQRKLADQAETIYELADKTIAKKKGAK